MKKQTAFFLIALLVISPVVSAIDHCAGMHGVNAVEQSHQMLNASLMGVDDSSLDQHNLPHNTINCHDSGDCSLHLCGGHAVLQSSMIFNSVISSDFQQSVTLPLYRSPSYLAIKPPILIL